MNTRLTHVFDQFVELEHAGQPLFRYVYAPATEARETPKPYFHPVRTLAGNLVTNFRPHDHVWHHGIAMTFSHLSEQNFWGGPSYAHGRGYVQLPNNGRIQHQSWEEMRCDESGVVLQERLTWISYEGQPWLEEQRRIAVGEINVSEAFWTLEFGCTLRNVRGEPLHFGSPTTVGRPLAGYGSLAWRGPRSFLNGNVLASGDLEGPGIMGQAAPWLAYTGKHDGPDGPRGGPNAGGKASTLVFTDQPGNPRYPTKWFVRNEPYALVTFGLTFDEELHLQPDEELSLRYRILIADGAWSRDRIERFA